MGQVAGASKARRPTRLKVVDGTERPSRKNTKEPAKPFVMPAPPPDATKEQKEHWAKFAQVLGATRITTEDDFAAFELMVTLWGQWQQLQTDLRAIYKTEGSYMYETTNQSGSVMMRMVPQLAAAGDVERRLLPLLGRFGMTPADRSRVSVLLGADGQRANPEDEFT